MVGIVTATSIEANHRAIRPLHIIAVVSVHCIGLSAISDHYTLEGIALEQQRQLTDGNIANNRKNRIDNNY